MAQDGTAGGIHRELVELVALRARPGGRTPSALPGLWFFRFDRPQPKTVACSATMYLGVALQGKKRIRIGAQELVYDRFNYFVVRGDVEYTAHVEDASPDRPYLALGLSLSPAVVAQTLVALADLEALPSSARRTPGPPAFLSTVGPELLGALIRLVRAADDPAERRILAPLVVREIVFHLLQSEAAAYLRAVVSEPTDASRIGRAISFIEENAARRLTVDAIAKHVAMSPSHFAHSFREVASSAPMQYVRLVRLERARELLAANGTTVAEVASRIGYASASHFTRDFKRQYGTTPASYARTFGRRAEA